MYSFGVVRCLDPDTLVLVQFQCRGPDINALWTSVCLVSCFLFGHMAEVRVCLSAMCSSVSLVLRVCEREHMASVMFVFEKCF